MLVSASLLSCATPSGPIRPEQVSAGSAASAASLYGEYAGLAKTGGQVYAIDPDTSDIRIFVFRGGPAARFGHNHILSAPSFAGRVFIPKAGVEQARFDLVFRLDQLDIDPPVLVRQVGGGFTTALSADDLAGVRAHMLGERNMQADRYPSVHIRSLRIVGEAPAIAAQVEVDMHGRQRDMWLPLQVAVSPGGITANGALVLRQSDFGITPYSVLGGLLAVQDQVVIEFKLAGRAVSG